MLYLILFLFFFLMISDIGQGLGKQHNCFVINHGKIFNIYAKKTVVPPFKILKIQKRKWKRVKGETKK